MIEEANPDRYIKITEAATILGFAHYRSVNQMIERGALVGYRLPHVTRRRVLLSEVLALKEKAEKISQTASSDTPRGRGRPRKYG
jgi:hypothetical protein